MVKINMILLQESLQNDSSIISTRNNNFFRRIKNCKLEKIENKGSAVEVNQKIVATTNKKSIKEIKSVKEVSALKDIGEEDKTLYHRIVANKEVKSIKKNYIRTKNDQIIFYL